MEPRKYFAGDTRIVVGAVYYEEATGDDNQGDVIQITFSGGAPGTELTRILIDGHKDLSKPGVLENGDVFFDTAAGGQGVFNPVGLQIKNSNLFDVLSTQVIDGGTTLEILLRGFNAGEVLELSVDVDEKTFLSSTAVAEGGEFEGSHLWADFQAPHYEPASAHAVFWDFYDPNFAQYQGGLPLPPDRYEPANGVNREDRTAGAITDLALKALPNSIAGRVYVDHDRNLSQSTSEVGLAGVMITLRKEGEPQFVRTTVTNAQGDYRFDLLEPGIYTVVETQPADYQSVGATAGRVGANTRGQVQGKDEIRSIELLGGEDSVQNNFAETLPGKLSGYVYHDNDDDGNRDSGEEGIAGVEIRVIPVDAAGTTRTITIQTDATGYWVVDDLTPGSYRIEERQPARWLDGKDSVGSLGGSVVQGGDGFAQVSLPPGGNGLNYNFGELLPGSISGTVLVDRDDDCLFDPGEQGLAGVRIELLDAQGSVVAETLTDSGGNYSFGNVTPGVYSVRETQPSGYFEGKSRAGSAGGVAEGNTIRSISVTSGVASLNNNFCEIPPASLAGRVFADLNDDCLQDPGESGLANVLIELLNEQGEVVAATRTSAAGDYKFEQLTPGVYSIRESQPSGYLDGGEKVGTAGGRVSANDLIAEIRIEGGEQGEHYDFCEMPPASLAGSVFADLDDDCLQDPGEEGLANVLIELLNERGEVVATTRTNANGDYQFDQLRPGAYSIRESQPAGFLDGGERVGSAGGIVRGNDLLGDIRLQGGVQATDYDFCEIPPSTLSGRVFADTDQDCVYDSGEQGLEGVQIELLDERGNIVAVTRTGLEGEYSFVQLKPGVYTVRESQPEGYLDGAESVGSAGGRVLSNDLIGEIRIQGGMNAVEYNFCETPPASLSGFVHQDSDGDCFFDPGERPLAGVVIHLIDGQGNLVAVTRTNAQGAYSFNNLPPGEYSIQEIQPNGWNTAGERPGNLGGQVLAPNLIGSIRVNTGAHGVDYNFCETEPPIPIVFPIETPPLQPLERIVQYVPFERDASPPTVFTPLEKPYLRLATPGAPQSWHLSIVDAGQPRKSRSTVASKGEVRYASSSDSNKKTVVKAWQAVQPPGNSLEQKNLLQMPEGTPVTGDFNGDGITDFGIYINGEWFIDLNSDRTWNEGDLWAKLGDANDVPITGDWNGDGKTDIGVYGMAWAKDPRAIEAEPGLPDPLNSRQDKLKNPPPAPEEATSGARDMQLNSQVEMRRDVIDHVFGYGAKGDRPVVGDWDGDGIDSIGVFREGTWYLDVDGDGRWTPRDRMVSFGGPDDIPVAGDWNGDGIDEIGVYRGGTWLRDMNGDGKFDSSDRTDELGGSGDAPLVGDWNGDGIDEISVYTSSPAPRSPAPSSQNKSADSSVNSTGDKQASKTHAFAGALSTSSPEAIPSSLAASAAAPLSEPVAE